MGTSARGILLSGIYCMLGLYTVSFNASEETNRNTAVAQAAYTKAEQLALAGISLARTGNANKKNSPPTTEIVDGVSITYSYTKLQGKLYNIFSTVTIDGQTVTIVACAEYDNGTSRWKIIDTLNKSALKKTKK